MAEIELIPEDRKKLVKSVLKAASSGLLIAGSVAAPNLLRLLARSVNSDETERTLRSVRYAKERGWITFKESPEGLSVALTASGKLKWQKIQLERPVFDKKWDGRWRLVIFDIPAKQRGRAEALRRAITQLGLRRLQKSVWITPYTCQTQIGVLRQLYNIKQYTQVIEAAKIENETDLKNLFNLPP